MPDANASSKPPKPPRRLWLFLPYAAVAVLAVVGGIGWVVLKTQLEHRLDETATKLRSQGYQISWQSRRIDGFPFRLDLTLEQPRIAEPSGWALAAPELKSEAYAYEPDRWIIVAPSGLTVTRPGKGSLDVTGRAIRASLSGLGGAARFSFEGVKLTFKPQPGATPGQLSSADRLELHLQPGPDDQAALLIRVDGGRASPTSPLSRLAATAPVSAQWDSRLSHVSQFRGADWPSAVRHWTAAGGQMSLVQAGLTATPLTVSIGAASLAVGDDGRLRGVLPLTLHQGSAALDTLGAMRTVDPTAARTAAMVAQARQGPDGAAVMALTFQAGVATLGPVSLGPAPRIY